MNNMKRQNDRILKEELPRSVGAQYPSGDQWRNNSRKNEGMEPKQKQYPVLDVTSDRNRRRQWYPTPVLLPGKSHGWRRNLVGCSPWGRSESDTTEQLHFHFSPSCIGEGKLQPSPMVLPGESQGLGSVVGYCLWVRTESDSTEVT